jgi:hypothetical protein
MVVETTKHSRREQQMPVPKLTEAQTEVLETLLNDGWLALPYFNPCDAFPGRDNQDNARRRTCTQLEKKRYLLRAGDMVGVPSAFLFRPNWKVIEEWKANRGA